MDNLKQKIQQDTKEALKAGNTLKRSVLGMLNASIKNKEIENRGKGKEEELSDDEIIAIIGTEVKKRKDASEQFEKGGRQDLAQKEMEEALILKEYLPEQLSEEEVTAEIINVIREVGAEGIKDLPKVMGPVMQKLKGRADGSLVSRIVKEQLSK